MRRLTNLELGYETMKVQIQRMKIQPSLTTGEQKERNPTRDCMSISEIEPEVTAFAAACLARSSFSTGSRASILLVPIR